MTVSSASPRQLLGRDPQLVLASSLLDDLARSRGHLLLLVGDPGIGKTRLAEEIVTRAETLGADAAWATAWQGDGTPPLWTWMQILRQIAGSADVLDHPSLPEPAASTAVRFEQLEAIAALLRDRCATGPLVVVIDDLQWAEPASVRVLTFVASALRDAPCLLVATYRAGELERTAEAELARVGTTLAVPPLADDVAAELLRSAVGGDVSSAATRAIVDRSGGNPLFVWELGQLLSQSGRLDVAPAAVPGAVALVIERRLARLSEASIAMLRVAAIGGDPFTLDHVAAVSGRAVDEVAAGLAAAVRDGLVVETASPATYAFAHGIIRDVVIDGIETVHRAELHRRAAVAFEARARTDPAFHAAVAGHLLGAGGPHVAAASVHWELAARHALRVVAYDEAAVLFERAAAACAGDRPRWIHLVVDHSDALLLAGDLARARDGFLRAATAARTSGEAELFARAVLGIGTGSVGWEVPMGDESQAELVAEALAMVPPDAIRLRSMLLARLSITAATPDTHDVARERAASALELAEQVGDPALIGQALAALNDAIAGPSHTMARRENADAIVELAVTAGDRALELLGHRFRVVADLEAGDIAAVDRDIVAFSRLADQLRQPIMSWYVSLFHGMRALLAGDVDRAEQHQAEVARAAAETGSTNAAMLGVTLLLAIDVVRERPPTSLDQLEELLSVDPAAWSTYAAGSAFFAWHAGDHDRARDMLELHSRNRFARLGDDAEHLTTLVMFGRVAVGLDDVAAVELVYDLLRPHTGLWSVDGIAACCWGPVDLDLGRLALALGRPVDARAHLAAAREGVERANATLLAREVDELVQQCGSAVGIRARVGGEQVFRRDGQFWTLTYLGTTVRLKDAKGLRDIARLLAEPDRELHVLDLAGSRDDAGGGGDLGELLDARARAEYRRRLGELDDELADAEACGDRVRADRAHDERAFLAAELSAALGLGGRPRRVGDPVERARKAVSGRIRMTIGRIDLEHAALARHLAVSVRTGTYCVYAPEVTAAWEL